METPIVTNDKCIQIETIPVIGMVQMSNNNISKISLVALNVILSDPVRSGQIKIGTPEWNALTLRRCTLIDKKYDEKYDGLTASEEIELKQLHMLSGKILDRSYPRANINKMCANPGILSRLNMFLKKIFNRKVSEA